MQSDFGAVLARLKSDKKAPSFDEAFFIQQQIRTYAVIAYLFTPSPQPSP